MEKVITLSGRLDTANASAIDAEIAQQLKDSDRTTEKNTKNELTDIFEIAIKKAEDTMKEKGYEAQPKNETVLVIYEFGESTAKTTLKFTVPVYYAPDK